MHRARVWGVPTVAWRTDRPSDAQTLAPCVADAITIAYVATAAIVAVLAFRDAPQRLLAAHRAGRVLDAVLYHVVNAASVVVVATWLVLVAFGWDNHLVPGGPISQGIRGLGLAVGVAGFALGAWARISLGRAFAPTAAVPVDEHIVDAGPYAHVRHPFYVGLMLALASGVLALDRRVTLATWIVLAPLVRTIAVLEEQHLATTLGKAYRAYQARVPRWAPRLSSAR